MRVLGTKSTTYSAPRYSSVWPRWRPKPFTSVTVMPETPMSDSAARTSSSLNGLMIAVTSFMCELSVGFPDTSFIDVSSGPAYRRPAFRDFEVVKCSFHATVPATRKWLSSGPVGYTRAEYCTILAQHFVTFARRQCGPEDRWASEIPLS